MQVLWQDNSGPLNKRFVLNRHRVEPGGPPMLCAGFELEIDGEWHEDHEGGLALNDDQATILANALLEEVAS